MGQSAKDHTELVQQIEQELLEVGQIDRVMQVTVFDLPGAGVVVGAQVSLPAELDMRQVSASLAVAKRRIKRIAPKAQHIFVTPDIYFDDSKVASTSTIVTLSYD